MYLSSRKPFLGTYAEPWSSETVTGILQGLYYTKRWLLDKKKNVAIQGILGIDDMNMSPFYEGFRKGN